jgi:excinuclease ABC subunit A
VLVVEHDEDTIRVADYVVDIGPGAGEHGGEVVYSRHGEGPPQVQGVLTGQYLSGKRSIPVPERRRAPGDSTGSQIGAREHNLRNLDVASRSAASSPSPACRGSGKSTLVNDILCAR